jgi:uncharacterized protein YdeI (YjbR/CyaY-like superfamily)
MPAAGPGPDNRYLRDELPRELVAALASAPVAQARFERLSRDHRREYVRWVRDGRRDDTRERRAAQTVMRLLEQIVLPDAARADESTPPPASS